MANESPQVSEGLSVETLVSQLTPEHIQKNYLTGLEFVDQNGQPYDSGWYSQHINTAIVTFERFTKVHVLQRTITEEMHDYFIEDYQLFAFIQLFEYPVLSVEGIRAVYPTGQSVFEFPLEWVRLTPEHGQIQLVPTQGTLSQVILGRGGSYLPLLYSGLGYLPQLFRVDYTTGFAAGKVPWDIVDAIAKLACIAMLAVAGETIFPPGVTSISAGIDGLSQGLGISNPVFKGRIDMYNLELYGDGRMNPGSLRLIKDHYRGLMMRVM